MTDEPGQTYPFTVDSLLDKALGPEGYFGAFTANMHTDEPQIPECDAIVSSALERGVPIVSSRQMLDWVDGRNSSSFSELKWNNGTLSFDIHKDSRANGLRALVPYQSTTGAVSSARRDGVAVDVVIQTIKGREYAALEAESGAYVIEYGSESSGL
jgi:hypothetical protein